MQFSGIVSMILFPLLAISIALIALRRSKNVYYGAMGMGFLSYTLIGFLLAAFVQSLVLSPISDPWVYIICLAAIITLLDFAARFVSTLPFKSRNHVYTALSIGLGQATARTLLLDIFKAASFMAILMVYTSPDFDPVAAQGEFLLNAQSLLDTPWYVFLFDTLEYVLLFFAHIALSLYSVRAIMGNMPRNMAISVALQFVLEVILALLMVGIVTNKYLEYFVALEAGIFGIYYIVKTVKAHPGGEGQEIVRLSRR